VTADGSLVVASEQENADLLWAVRGAGPGFFGVVTEYTLRLFPAPGAIMTSNYHYPLELAPEAGEWAAHVARELPKQVELTFSFGVASPSIADRCKADKGFACSISATAFAGSIDAAAAMLRQLDSCPVAAHCLLRETDVPTPIEILHELNARSTPPGHRYLVDSFWTNSPPAKMLEASRSQFVHAPSSKSIELLSFSTGAELAALSDCAFSMSGDALLICSAIWEGSEDDPANTTWHRATTAALDEYAIGRYIGESDIVTDPGRAERSYSKSNWQRLSALREKYDPTRLFQGDFSVR
jgi:FAD/FMN-containing dehydrogenase